MVGEKIAQLTSPRRRAARCSPQSMASELRSPRLYASRALACRRSIAVAGLGGQSRAPHLRHQDVGLGQMRRRSILGVPRPTYVPESWSRELGLNYRTLLQGINRGLFDARVTHECLNRLRRCPDPNEERKPRIHLSSQQVGRGSNWSYRHTTCGRCILLSCRGAFAGLTK